MNYYQQPSDESNERNFSSNQIRALSNGIGIGQTRQKRSNFSGQSNPEKINIHQTAYAQVIEQQSVSFRQKHSKLYAINRFYTAFILDLVILSSILGAGAFAAYLAFEGVTELSLDSVKLSIAGFKGAAVALTSSLKLIEIVLIPSALLLTYYLGLTLLLGRTVGFSIFKK